MSDTTQLVLQLIYDRFCDGGGKWPTLRYLQRALNRHGYDDVDTVRIVRQVPAILMNPLSAVDYYPAPTEKLALTAEGVKRCAGSDADIANFVMAVKWLAMRAERSELSGDRSERGMRFTSRELAGAVSLSLDSDSNAVDRLVAILQAEGWVQDDGGRRGKTWTRSLRTLRNSGFS